MNTKDNDRIQEMFASEGLRCTAQRRALYKVLAASTCHPTAEQLYYEVSGSITGLSLATVYNTLEAFCQAGLCQKLPGKGGSVRYDAMVHNHLHTRCEKSGAVYDVPDVLGQKLLDSVPSNILRTIEQQLGFKINRVNIELVGEHTGTSST